jgi:1-deoxy-D-xylulose 5-phosphate reductoisomerase
MLTNLLTHSLARSLIHSLTHIYNIQVLERINDPDMEEEILSELNKKQREWYAEEKKERDRRWV